MILKKKGDFVKTWFDTGAFGMTPLYGIVTKAGPKRFEVRWESGIVNRLVQDYYDITVISSAEIEDETFKTLTEHRRLTGEDL